MTEGIWQQCQGARLIGPLKVEMIRVVESQEEIATLSLVDSMDEQRVLEQLLEDTKPGQLQASRHYLLTTPFRYPPLRWGSRFGRTHEPSLFYASLSIKTALTECAFYRFVFINGVEKSFPQAVVSQHTSFSVIALSEKGADLTRAPYDAFLTDLCSPQNYSACQQLGHAMREDGVELFVYRSARDHTPTGINAAAFRVEVFGQHQPSKFQSWTCYATHDKVRYMSSPDKTAFEFSQQQFLVDGAFPIPPTP